MPPFTGETKRCRHSKDVHRGLDGSSWVEAVCADGRVQIYCRYCGRVYGYRVPEAVDDADQAVERDLFGDRDDVGAELATVNFAAAADAIRSRRRGRRPRGGGPSAA